MASPPVLVVQWRCGDCGDLCNTAEEAAVHCDEAFWDSIEQARNQEIYRKIDEEEDRKNR